MFCPSLTQCAVLTRRSLRFPGEAAAALDLDIASECKTKLSLKSIVLLALSITFDNENFSPQSCFQYGEFFVYLILPETEYLVVPDQSAVNAN